jgi:ATP-binding cassette, subfamily B, bacterial
LSVTTQADIIAPSLKQTPTEEISIREVFHLLRRSWPYYSAQWRHLLTLLVFSGLSGVLMFAVPLVALDLFNNGVLVGEPITSFQASLLFLDQSYVATGVEGELLTDLQRQTVRNHFFVWGAALSVFAIAIYAGGLWYMTWIYARINQGLRVVMMERAENLSLRYHSDSKTGDAMYRIYQDSATITNVFMVLVLSPTRAVIWTLFAILVIVGFSPILGLVCLLTAIPVLYLFYALTPAIRHWSRQARRANSDLTSRVQEVFTGIKVIKSNRAEGQVLDRFISDSQMALDAAFHLRFRIALLQVGVTVAVMMATLVMQYLMANWTITEKATYLGGTVAIVGFVIWNLGAYQAASAQTGSILRGVRDLVDYWGVGQDLIVGLKRAFFLLDLEPEVTEIAEPVAFPAPVQKIAWQQVDFSYDASKQRILENINLAAEAGTITAIVGSTGTGKSTLMSLLLRLYDPDNGTVKINDTDISQLSIAELRSHVAIALQKNVLFTRTVAENIAYAATNKSREEIEAAARVACAHDFILEMKDGYDTELGERGGKLSTGQRQRLSIARAILRDTPILILDEPTASLDAVTEHQVLENLHEWGRSRVVFLITHRLSTIRNADQIAFMKDGSVCELGSHEELMAVDNGHYRDFVETELYGVNDSPEQSL